MITEYATEAEIQDLIQAFESCTLPRIQWTHTAHLTVALYYLLHNSYDDAVDLIRQGIQTYNRSQGIEQTPTGGYHETITCFWIYVIHTFLDRCAPNRSLLILANQLICTYNDPQLLFEYYTRACLFSSTARFHWVEPDLKPLTVLAIK